MTTVLTEIRGRVGYITMNRPDKLNALNDELLCDLYDAVQEMEAAEAVRVIVLRAAGRAFCAGFDLSPREKPFTTMQDWRGHAQLGNRTFFAFWNCKKPVIAQVQGYCLGGGCDLALVCDFTIAGEGAVFGEPEVQISSSTPFLIMPWIIDMKKAKELLMLGDKVNAAEAERIGLITRVVPDENLDTEVDALALKMVKIPVPAMEMTKMAINRGYEIAGMTNAILNGEEAFAATLMCDNPETAAFFEVANKEGLAAAFKWRDALFAQEAQESEEPKP